MTPRLRVGVYNRFWPTAGGGERFAGGIAQALATRHDVDLIGHDDLDVAAVAARLGLDLSGVGVRIVARSPTEVEAASAHYDLFVNVSYGSADRSLARWSLYVVHFPVAPPFPPSRWRPKTLGALERLARLLRVDLAPARWSGGAYAPERLGPLTQRWTDGAATLQLAPAQGRRTLSVLVMRPPHGPAVPVEVTADGHQVGRAVIEARRRRWRPLQTVTVPVPRGEVTVQLRSATHLASGPASDRRRLGICVVAVTTGRGGARLLQAIHQPLSSPGVDLAFLDTYQVVASNSAYTAGWVQRRWGRHSVVLPPPVTSYAAAPAATATGAAGKAPLILHVGRFFAPGTGHSKRQLDLVEAFRRLSESGAAAGWELVLVGGCDEDGLAYLDEVRQAAAGLAVTVHADAPAPLLAELWGRASIYWHGTGLGDDPDVHPERFEHFGISTVEAMSAGAVPVVIGAAGQLEVVDDGVEGVHFADLDELVAATAALVADPSRRREMATKAQERAQLYNWQAFCERLDAVVDLVTGGSPPT